LLIIALSFLFTSASASAEVDKNKLIGTWTGNIVVYFHASAKAIAVDMTFQADGTYTLRQDHNGKSDHAQYKVVGDKILVTDGQDKNTYLIDIKLDDTTFKGRFESNEKADKQGISIEFALRRKVETKK